MAMYWYDLKTRGNTVVNNKLDYFNKVNITKQNYAAGTKQLTFFLNIKGSSDKVYSSVVSFYKIKEFPLNLDDEKATPEEKEAANQEVKELLKDSRNMMVEDSEGNPHIIVKPSLDKNPIQVNCSCPNFRFTYSWENKDAGALYGAKAPKYTPTGTRPPRNPTSSPGACKHLQIAVENLLDSGLITD